MRGISQPARAIIYGGMIGGSLDISYACLISILGGRAPETMLKGIAAGLLGRSVVTRGTEIAILGLALHFVIALGAATTYYAVSRKVTLLVSRAPICGPLFGAIVYLIMNRIVLPLSALHVRPQMRMPGLLAVMFLVGLPIALSVQRFSRFEAPCEESLAAIVAGQAD